MSLSTALPKKYISPVRCSLPSLLRSRRNWRIKYGEQRQLVGRLQKEVNAANREIERLRQRMRQQQAQHEIFEKRRAQSAPHHCWPILRGHQYSAAMIAMCCQLAAIVGFRAAPRVLELMNMTFGLKLNIPSRDVIRNWTCRAGIALLRHEKADDWIWLVDHSVQLGSMQVLVVLGIRQSQLPYRQDSSSRALRREDLHVLAVLPSQSKCKEQVIADVEPLSELLGTPLAVVCDGASELKAAVESLQTPQQPGETPSDASVCSGPAHLVDVKHRVSSGLKKLLAGDEVFQDFSKRTGRCAAHIRQTELDHLVPPTRKDKCRFMNLHREIRWAGMVLRQLDRKADCQDPSSVRLREKLGWLVEFREAIKNWQQWCELIGETLSFNNQYGVYRGGGDELNRRLESRDVNRQVCSQVWEILLNAYSNNEEQLNRMAAEVTCLPGSTELLESVFGSYKAMQRHHNRGTFTTLLAALPTVLHRFRADSIRLQFSRVSNKQLKTWLREHGLLDSTQSRRTRAYAKA